MPTTPTLPSSGLADLSRIGTDTAVKAIRKRPPRIVLVVACSRRKRMRAPFDLRLSSIDAAPNERATQWRERLDEVSAVQRRAQELYTGDHWHAACEAYRLAQRYSSRAELWVISAGYGLIRSSKPIKPYSATFAIGSVDSVWRGQADGNRQACLQDWWQVLSHDASLPDLLQGDGAIVIAAGAPYLEALTADLEAAFRHDPSGERISVVSAGSRGNSALLPVNGQYRSVVGGTDAAINARVLTLLAAEAPVHHFRRSAMTSALTPFASHLPVTTRRVGKAVTNDEVARLIIAIRRRLPTASRTQALREVRSAGIACEQSRFASIWNATVGDQGDR